MKRFDPTFSYTRFRPEQSVPATQGISYNSSQRSQPAQNGAVWWVVLQGFKGDFR